jgi:hypothetical protein
MIDDRGRLFGVLNLVDALILLFLLGVIPLGYVAYRVFRVPPPRIDRIEPASQSMKPELRIRLIGQNLRPYLRLWVNKTGEPFSVTQDTLRMNEARMLTETPTAAEARLSEELTPGSYDVHLFDGSREIATKTAAFSLVSPTTEVEVVARFPVDESIAGLVHAGDQDVLVAGSARFPSTTGYARITGVRTLDKPVTAFALQAGRMGLQMPARMLEATVQLPATRSENNVWEYRKQSVRPGDPLVIDTPAYVMYGFVVEVRPPGHSAAASSGVASK